MDGLQDRCGGHPCQNRQKRDRTRDRIGAVYRVTDELKATTASKVGETRVPPLPAGLPFYRGGQDRGLLKVNQI